MGEPLLIAQAILSWLLAFGVVNRWNRGVAVLRNRSVGRIPYSPSIVNDTTRQER